MSRPMRALSIGLVALIVLVGVLIVGIFALSGSRLSRRHAIEGKEVAVSASPDAIERGRHKVRAVLACTDCHGEDLGGTAFIDAAAMGTIWASNLTAGEGGIGKDYTLRDWDRAIRHGVNRDAEGLLIMPAEAYIHLTDSELGDIIAYLQSLPPVDRKIPPRTLGPVARALLAFGQPLIPAERIDHAATGGSGDAPTTGLALGAHLIKVSGCDSCHQADLAGGKIPGADPSWPPAGNLTPHPEGLDRYSAATFDEVMRSGKKLDGTQIDPSMMPWTAYAKMTNEEISALWAYLQTVEPKPTRK